VWSPLGILQHRFPGFGAFRERQFLNHGRGFKQESNFLVTKTEQGAAKTGLWGARGGVSRNSFQGNWTVTSRAFLFQNPKKGREGQVVRGVRSDGRMGGRGWQACKIMVGRGCGR